MPKSLQDYADWLDDRKLLWPAAPEPVRPKATPYLKRLPGIRAVVWDVYGTLLSISEGRLLTLSLDPLRMEVALDKTIREFNMWNSMSRKPGAPWEYMFQQYKRLVEAERLAASPRAGEAPETDSAHIWKVLIERLGKKDFTWDESSFGGIDEFSEKVAWFFHAALQGTAAAPSALKALKHVRRAGLKQGLVADGQCFTLVQLARALRAQGTVTSFARLFSRGCVCLSFQYGVRQPAVTLFEACLARLARRGIAPEHVLYVASRLKENLRPARSLGMRTALYAGDAVSLEATSAEIKDSELRPDRILTDLRQIRQIVKVD
jgi:FMN phosphatase YigB (HAD superfamily)